MYMYACTAHIENIVFKAEENIEMSLMGWF
jgi:hypothetical protein